MLSLLRCLVLQKVSLLLLLCFLLLSFFEKEWPQEEIAGGDVGREEVEAEVVLLLFLVALRSGLIIVGCCCCCCCCDYFEEVECVAIGVLEDGSAVVSLVVVVEEVYVEGGEGVDEFLEEGDVVAGEALRAGESSTDFLGVVEEVSS